MGEVPGVGSPPTAGIAPALLFRKMIEGSTKV
jgi:hypothetical protein